MIVNCATPLEPFYRYILLPIHFGSFYLSFTNSSLFMASTVILVFFLLKMVLLSSIYSRIPPKGVLYTRNKSRMEMIYEFVVTRVKEQIIFIIFVYLLFTNFIGLIFFFKICFLFKILKIVKKGWLLGLSLLRRTHAAQRAGKATPLICCVSSTITTSSSDSMGASASASIHSMEVDPPEVDLPAVGLNELAALFIAGEVGEDELNRVGRLQEFLNVCHHVQQGGPQALDAALCEQALLTVCAAAQQNLSATDGSVSQNLSATDGSVSQDLSTTDGSVSQNLSATDGSVSQDLSATDGSVSQDPSATDGSVSQDPSATDGSVSVASSVASNDIPPISSVSVASNDGSVSESASVESAFFDDAIDIVFF